MTNESKTRLSRLLAYAVSCENAARAADAASQKCSSLADLGEHDMGSLRSMTELTDSALMLLALAAEATSRRKTDSFSFGTVHSEEEIAEYFKGIFIGSAEERIYIMCLDANRRAIACDLVGVGSVNSSAFSIRRLVETALARGAKYVYLAHNHPIGYANPSSDDMVATDAVIAAFATVRIGFLGHLVVSGTEYARIHSDLSIELPRDRDKLKVASDTKIKN